MATVSDEFLRAVAGESAAVQRFTALLALEQEMLTTGQVDQLFELVQQKNGVAAQLAALGAQRNESLAASGLPPDRAGVSAWLAAHPEETAAHAAWSSLLSLAGKARELNRVNGELIQIRLQNNAQAIATLLGTRSSPRLYGRDGQSAASGSNRISDRA